MNLQEQIIEYGLSFPATYLDYPFDDSSIALRHERNSKIFALFVRRTNTTLLNLKCEPMRADFWRSAYEAVIPGFHMNKTHWNSIQLHMELPWDVLQSMIEDSYSLTKPKIARYKGHD